MNLYMIVLVNCIKNLMDTQIMYENKVFQYFCRLFFHITARIALLNSSQLLVSQLTNINFI